MAPDDVIVGLDHVQIPIPAGSEAAIRTFYGGILGMTEVPKPPPLAVRGGCWFVANGIALHFGVEESFQPWRKAHVALLVDDLDGLRARLEAAGIVTIDDPTTIGVRRFHTTDPLGNRLELVDVRDGGFTVRTVTS